MKTNKIIALIFTVIQFNPHTYTMEQQPRQETAADLYRRYQEALSIEREAARQAQSKQEQLNPAIKSGNIEKIKQLIAENVNLNQPDYWGNTPLMTAANSPAILKFLLQAGADPMFNPSRTIPIILQSIHPKGLENVRILLAMGTSNVNCTNTGGNTPLILAANQKLTEIAKALIDAGANVNIVGWEGLTALHHAVSNSNRPLIQYLIEHGANTTIQNGYKKSPLDMASVDIKQFVLDCIASKREMDELSQHFQQLHLS